MRIEIVAGLLIPLAGTMLGAAVVFLFRGEMNHKIQKCFLGFASGVMIAASIWSLLMPSIEMAESAGGVLPAWFPAAAGFIAGIGFLLMLDLLIPHLHISGKKPEGRKSSLGKSTMLILAVTLHNIPEGMAVGVVFAGLLTGDGVTLPAAFALSAGIALQNIPEGAVVAMPLIGGGMRRRKAFLYGTLSGVVEPVSAFATVALTTLITPALPYILAFAAGSMFYVVIEELVPEAQAGEHSNAGTVSAALGFLLMMILDVALG